MRSSVRSKRLLPVNKPDGRQIGWDFQAETGTRDPNLQAELIGQVAKTLWLPEGLDDEARQERLLAAISLLKGIAPQDEIEGMLAVQMTATHSAALECLRRAMIEGQSFEGRNQNLKHATRLLTIYTQQMATLNKHRGKGQQKVTVEYVNVESGGQAIVGNVQSGQAPAGNKKPARTRRRQADAPPRSSRRGETTTVEGCRPELAQPGSQNE